MKHRRAGRGVAGWYSNGYKNRSTVRFETRTSFGGLSLIAPATAPGDTVAEHCPPPPPSRVVLTAAAAAAAAAVAASFPKKSRDCPPRLAPVVARATWTFGSVASNSALSAAYTAHRAVAGHQIIKSVRADVPKLQGWTAHRSRHRRIDLFLVRRCSVLLLRTLSLFRHLDP